MSANGAEPSRNSLRAGGARQVSRAARGGGLRLSRSARRSEDGIKVAEIQRSRLLVATIGVVDQFGYDGASVARIAARARVSRRTFYDLFENREQCLLAAFESVVDRLLAELDIVQLDTLPWRERMRTGLWTVLVIFDREPALARLCVVQAQRGDVEVLERRQRILDELATAIDAGRGQSIRGEKLGTLTGAAVVGGVLSILYARLLDRTRRPGSLRDLHGELMAMIVLPYAGPQAARREQERTPPADEPITNRASTPSSYDSLVDVPMRLTYRTASVLGDVGEHPGSSNRQIAERVGIQDQGQVSKLLARLQRIGLLANAASGAPAKGDANAWHLSETGEQIVSAMHVHAVAGISSKTACAAPSAGTPDSREGR